MFEIGQQVRVTTGWVTKDHYDSDEVEHYLWKNSTVEVVGIGEIQEDGPIVFVYAQKDCFVPGEYGIPYKNFEKGTQRISTYELSPFIHTPKTIGEKRLPEI